MTTKWMRGSTVRKILVSLTIIIIIFSRFISDRIFLGQQVAYTYLGQDIGFEELYLFKNGKCKITYGGVFGVSDTHYGTFKVIDSTLYVGSKAKLLDLESHTIKLDDKTLIIKLAK